MPNRVDVNDADPVDHRVRRALRARASGSSPRGTQTLAKGPGQYVRGVAPKYLRARQGRARLGRRRQRVPRLQHGASARSSLGYAYPAVDDAIRAQLDDGITFSLMHPLEVEVAELVRDVVPGAETVRFSKTGCDVTTAAVRLARAFTGREQGALLRLPRLARLVHRGHRPRPRASRADVADLTYTFEYNDLDVASRDALDDDTACVILEPTSSRRRSDGFLEELQRALRRDAARC